MRRRSWGALLALVVVFGCALALRLYGMNWDGGQWIHPDERMILMVVNNRLAIPTESQMDLLLTPKSPLNPAFHAYGSVPLYLLKTAQLLTGDRFPLHLLARSISVAFDCGTVLLVFALAFRRYRPVSRDDVAEERDSVLSLDLVRAQLGQLLRRRRQGPPGPPYVPLASEDPAVSIRRTYQTLLAAMAERGLARAPGTTPAEYLAQLVEALPEHRAGLALITAAYQRARYGTGAADGYAPAEAEVAAEAARAWAQIVQTLPATAQRRP